ncbi:hypothetical protein [Paraburkholderia phenazinium]|uniref:hypothetical protein n=1 Tax=Paraburkholderia sp. GAS82 TaxID=3035137 RepID=UPI001062EF70
MSDMAAAVVGASTVLVVAYGTNFLAEEYRRFLDAKALASALCGELRAHMSAVPRMKETFPKVKGAGPDGKPKYLPQIDPPTSPIFDANVTKLGLLGEPLAGEVAFAYEILRAFRGLLGSLLREQRDLAVQQFDSRIQTALDLIVEHEPQAHELITALANFTGRRFWASPTTWLQLYRNPRGSVRPD